MVTGLMHKLGKKVVKACGLHLSMSFEDTLFGLVTSPQNNRVGDDYFVLGPGRSLSDEREEKKREGKEKLKEKEGERWRRRMNLKKIVGDFL